MNDLLAHLWPWTDFLRKTIEEKNYDGALSIIKDIRKKWKSSKEQNILLDKIEKGILEFKNK